MNPQDSKQPDSGKPLSLLQRLSLAFGAFFGVLGDAALAARFDAIRHGSVAASAAPPAKAAEGAREESLPRILN